MITVSSPIAKSVERIREGELDPRELVEFHLQRVQRLEGRVRAWAHVDARGAWRQAERASRRAREGRPLGGLHGIPLGIKDIIDVQGLPTGAGSRLREGRIALHDAPLVGRLRRAGAIVLGKTVTTECACFDPPPTRNPWNLAHTPGGSSSGSAAAVAAGMCAAAVGTQTGGSIIRPASYCGVAGFKPTSGHVSLEGVLPVSPHLDHAGPIARCVEDLALLYVSLSEPDRLDACLEDCRRHGQSLAGPESDRGRARGLWESWRSSAAGPPRLVVLDEFLRRAGVEVRDVTRGCVQRLEDAVQGDLALPEWFDEVYPHHRRIMARDVATYHGPAYAASPEAFGRSIAALIEEGHGVSPPQFAASLAHQQECRQRMAEWLPPGTFALLPATNVPAPARLDTTGDPAFNSPWSYVGFPSLTLPCGLTGAGMPCGLQLIGPPESDLRLLQAAAWCEQRLAFDRLPAIVGEG